MFVRSNEKMKNAKGIIEEKLHRFVRKYYYNELIKGGILFASTGLLYLFFVLWIEDILWLEPSRRKILFWLFIGVEALLALWYVVRPVMRLLGLSRGISEENASRIIGRHFSEIDDKLLNLLQLKRMGKQDELLLASIEQKAELLRPFPFQQAVRFSANKKYIKYLLIPIFIWLLFRISGKTEDLSQSYVRITHPQEVFIPPAPFQFILDKKNLKVDEGEPFTLRIHTAGESVPEEVSIRSGEEVYFMKTDSTGYFHYTFPPRNTSLAFHLEAAGVRSPEYELKVMPVPKIKKILLELVYPAYLHRRSETLRHSGNAVVPEGTRVTWKVTTAHTDRLSMRRDSTNIDFQASGNGDYSLTRRIIDTYAYRIIASNDSSRHTEDLPFSLQVIKDEKPKIEVHTDIDSLPYGPAQFAGRVSDDYGISKLRMVYYMRNRPDKPQYLDIPVKGSRTLGEFYLMFPGELDIPDGEDYELYFEVFDNDAVNAHKSTKSRIFHYHYDNETEKKEKILEEEKQRLDEMQQNLMQQKKNRQKLEKLHQDLMEKKKLDYDDAEKLRRFIQRQERYTQMMQNQSREIQEDLQKQPSTQNPSLEEKREDIQKRIEEFKDMQKEKQMLEELQRLAEKMQREDLLDKVKQMSTNNRQKEKSLEQLLELTKRFYVEQKQQQIIDRLKQLAREQEKLSESKENSLEKQQEIDKKFDQISQELKELLEENQKLKEPMDIDEQPEKQEQIREEQQKAGENLKNNRQKAASSNQKNAAQKMKQMAQSMQMQMDSASMDSIQEDIESLRRIIENLLIFSFDQEDLMLTLEDKGRDTPDYAGKLKKQYKLKTFFEHIDDSLYVLAMRQPKLTQKINEPLANAHYYLSESLDHMSEFLVPKATTDQHYVMKAANDLALLLSLLLDNMQGSLSMSGSGQGQGTGMGKGKGSGKGFQLPDIIQQQDQLGQQMQQGMQSKGQQGQQGQEGQEGQKGDKKGQKGDKGQGNKGQKNGNNGQGGKGGGTSENEMKEIYEIYKQQEMLRQALEDQLKDMQGKGIQAQGNKVKREMEELEKMLLDKGITQDVMEKLRRVQHELLKLKNAVNEQGMDNKRQSKSNDKKWDAVSPAQIRFRKKYLHEDEILNREPLPFKSRYRKIIQDYFNRENH